MLTRCLIALLLFCTPAAVAAGRGETSYRLPEIREATPALPHIARAPVWSHQADPPEDSDMLAIGDGVVAFTSSGRVCGYDDVTGVGVWCAGRGRAPVFTSGLIAYVGSDDRVHAIDARTGAPRWTYPNANSLWAVDGKLIAGAKPILDPRTSAYSVRLAGIDSKGRELWHVAEPNGSARVVPPYLFWRYSTAGATLHEYEVAIRPGPGGGPLTEVDGAILDLQPAAVIADTRDDKVEPIEDHFLTFDVAVRYLGSARSSVNYHYEPDYDANLVLYSQNCCVGASSGGKEYADGGFVYFVFDRRIYRYRLTSAEGQRPLLVASDSDLLGGPYNGTLYVARKDGVWSIRPESHDLRAQLVARSTTSAREVTVAHGSGFASFADGSIQGGL
jgi:PQQ-like domain